jgi:hypothetical protein
VVVCGLQNLAAHADTLDLFTFSLTGLPGTGTATISSSPTPSSFTNGTSFTLSGITASYDGSSYTGDVTFFETGGAGSQGVAFGGDKLYTGSNSAPTFRLGTFNLQGNVDLGLGNAPVVGSVTISQLPVTSTATPEPGTLAMVGTAAFGFAGMLRRRMA